MEEERKELDYRMPIYLQLREIVRSRIEDGEYLPGTAIPSENTLADTFGINRLTVRNAVDALVNEGILQRVQGKGVFVVGNKYESVLEEHGGFVSSISDRNKRIAVKELSKSIRKAGDYYSNYFGIEPEDDLFYLRHLRTIDGQPLSIEEIYIPHEIIPQLEEVNTSVFTMKDAFAFYGVRVNRMHQSLEIVEGNTKTRKLLEIPEGVALMMLSCDYFDDSGRLIECSYSLVRSDKCSFAIEMHM